MTTGWQKLRVPLLERLLLLELAERQGRPEEDILAEIIRDAVRREVMNSQPDRRHEGTIESERTQCP